MLILSGLLAIGIHLLVSTKVSYSLVLLSANLEDIKKIARQFVSETVADQIGKLFLQTNTKRNISISEENNLNNDVNKVSSENFEVPRANKTSSEDVEKILKEAMQRVKEMKDAVNDVSKIQNKLKEKRRTQKDYTKASTKSSDYYTYDFILSPEKTIKPKYEWKKGLNFDFLTTTNTLNNNNKQNENIYTRGFVSEKEGNSDQNKIDNLSSDNELDRRFEKSVKRIEAGIQRLKYTESEVTRNKKHDKENQIKSMRLRTENTTENVLDYYDNSIYIRKEIVATSGPVQLYKVAAFKETSISSEYSMDRDKEHVNVDLYFRKLLDSQMRKYNDNEEIKAKIANMTFDTSNKMFKENIVTSKIPLKVTNSTKQDREIKEKTANNLSYLDESDDLYYSK